MSVSTTNNYPFLLTELDSYYSFVQGDKLNHEYLKISDISIHAEPSLDINSRDLEALRNLLERDDASEIIEDVQRNLKMLSPEPPWDDDPDNLLEVFNFLF